MNTFQKIETSILVLVALIGLFFYQKIKDKSVKFVLVFIFWEAMMEIANAMFYDALPHGLFINYCYLVNYPVLFCTQYLVLKNSFHLSNTPKSIFILLSFTLLLVCSYEIKFNINNETSLTDAFIAYAIASLLVWLIYFTNLYQNKTIESINQIPLFWFATGNLMYFASNIFATGLFHRLFTESNDFAQAIYLINYIFGVLNIMCAGLTIFQEYKKAS